MITIQKNEFYYTFKIMYDLGGYNYYFNKEEPRGYRLNVEKYIIDGSFKKVMPQDEDNFRIFIKQAKRYNRRTYNKLNKTLNENQEELIDLYFNDRKKFIEKVFKIFK